MTLYFNLAQKFDGRDTSGTSGTSVVKKVRKNFRYRARGSCPGCGWANDEDAKDTKLRRIRGLLRIAG